MGSFVCTTTTLKDRVWPGAWAVGGGGGGGEEEGGNVCYEYVITWA